MRLAGALLKKPELVMVLIRVNFTYVVRFSSNSVEDLLLFGDECPVLWLSLDQASTD